MIGWRGRWATAGRLSLALLTVFLLAGCISAARSLSGPLGESLRVARLLVCSVLLYMLPGGAAVAWLLGKGDRVERLIVAAGVSVAINALLVYATMSGLRLSRTSVLSFLALCAGLIAVRFILAWRQKPRADGAGTGDPASSSDLADGVQWWREPSFLVLAAAVVLVFGVRIWVIRDILTPRWGDSYQHAMITQLLVDHGGIFGSWEPYAPYTGLTTHFGFHANAAMFHWVSGIGAVESVLWVGQIMNGLACLALYPLGRQIGGRWGGVFAVLVSGVLAATPMVYINWGRYPQLTGQILLPLAAWLLFQALDLVTIDWRLLVLAALPSAGQFLAYYRMPYYYVLLVGAWILCVSVSAFRLEWKRWRALMLKVGVVGALTVLLLLPWLAHLAMGQLAATIGTTAASLRDTDIVRASYQEWRMLYLYVSRPLLAIAVVAWLWALVRREAKVSAIGIWGVGMFSLVALRMIRVPGASHLTAFATMIFMYAPVSLLIGWLGAWVVRRVSTARPKWGTLGSVGLALVAAVLGAYSMPAHSDAGYDLVKPADLKAMDWIRTHTPRDALFLVNGFLVYGGSSVVGSDAGWWIPLLTDRANTMPPQYALFNERELEPGYGERMVNLVAELRQTPLSTDEGLGLLCREGITHVYAGQAGGRVGVPPPEPLFTAEEMLANPAFELLYDQDEVWIFALSDAACQQ